MKPQTETIVAAATPPGRGGVAVIRISGPLTKNIANEILRKQPTPRTALYTPFFDESKKAIDEGIALLFPAPNSFTGEDVLELQGHGGPVIVDLLIKRIISLDARIARPGEFSERAFLNDKLDLSQAEAIADLIDAASEQAARASMRSLQGEFSKKINELVEAITRVRIYVEAAIDFVDEEIDFLSNETIQNQLKEMLQLSLHIQQNATQGALLREGIHTVILGEPNVGKSSLLNALSGKPTAIVTEIPGTTRDVLKEYILIDGMPMHLIDTAGLRETNDVVEQEGIKRAKLETNKADLVLYVIDANTTTQDDNQYKQLTQYFSNKKILFIRNKIDLLNETPSVKQENDRVIISVSAKKDEGISLLQQQIKAYVGYTEQAVGSFSARRRHLDALHRAHGHIDKAVAQLKMKSTPELAAEDLRQAQKALGEITGEFTADDLLGRIFSSFCIGK